MMDINHAVGTLHLVGSLSGAGVVILCVRTKPRNALSKPCFPSPNRSEMIKTSCTFLELRVTHTCLISRSHLEYLLLVKIPVGPLPRTEPEWWWLGWDLYFQHVFKQAREMLLPLDCSPSGCIM